MRENAENKARRYLGDGRLTVEQVGENLVRATCRASGAIYDLWLDNGVRLVLFLSLSVAPLRPSARASVGHGAQGAA